MNFSQLSVNTTIYTLTPLITIRHLWL